MKFVIPAKTSSSRISNKNWREFYEGKSLIEIKIEQLIAAGVKPSDIHISCEDESKRDTTDPYRVTFSHRKVETTSDNFHWSDVVTCLVSSIDCDEEEPVAWVNACTPLFGKKEFEEAFDIWNETISESSFDCLVSVKKFKNFLLDERGRPINFNFGRWHEWSQDLPKWYILEYPIIIMKKKTYLRCNYFIGERPYMHLINEPSVDIDTAEDFKLAQMYFKEAQKDDQ